MKKDTLLLIINMVLLAVIAAFSSQTLRVLEGEQMRHRLRNEAESLCQLEALQLPIAQRTDLDQFLKIYQDCTLRRSGVGPPKGLKD